MKPFARCMLLLVAAASTADAKPKTKQTAKTHMQRAEKAHQQGNYEVALSELKAAYAIDPQPKLLYAIAQVNAKLDRCSEAIELYELFLATVKDSSRQAVVKQAIDACKQRLAEQASPPPAEPPARTTIEAASPSVASSELATAPPDAEPVPSSPPPAKPDTDVAPAVTTGTTHSPWYTDVLGDALVLGGLGATVGSIVMFRGAQSALDAAESAQTLDEYRDRRDEAERKQLYTVVLAGAGVALVTAGVLRYALRDSRRETPGLAIVPSDGGGLITWSGGF